MSSRLSEEQVADAFHSYLKSSLAQAKVERLLDAELLSSAEADLMITGPALCLYFAALRCTTNPPSVPLPRASKNGTQLDLSAENCPEAFLSFLSIWTRNVLLIQELAPEYQHDLARIICSLNPLAQPLNTSLSRIAAELRAVAIEISQRRTFQDRYAGDLQAAIDAGGGQATGGRVASFVPPPMYEPSPTASPNRSPASAALPLPPTEPLTPQRRSNHLELPTSPTSPHSSAGPSSRSHSRSRTPSPSPSSRSSPTSPSFFVDAPAIQLIRETLYASLAEMFATHPYLHKLLGRDASRAYYASVALAILNVSMYSTSFEPAPGVSDLSSEPGVPGGHVRTLSTSSAYTDVSTSGNEEPGVTGVLGARLSLRQCPPELRPFMRELAEIGRTARDMDEEDTMATVEAAASGARSRDLPEPRMDRVRRMVERGIEAESRRQNSLAGSGAGADADAGQDNRNSMDSTRSIEGKAILLTNRVNGLALSMTKLRAFRERQSEVFKVLASVRS